MFFKSKKIEPVKEDSIANQDLAIITQMNQEFATSLDLTETLQTALEVIIKRIKNIYSDKSIILLSQLRIFYPYLLIKIQRFNINFCMKIIYQ